MEITVEKEGPVPVLTLVGRLDAQGAAELDRSAQALGGEQSVWVLELSGVDYMSSMGLRSLLAAERALQAKDGGLILVGLKPFVRQVLHLSGVLVFMRTADSTAEALAAARASSESIAAPVLRELPGRSYAVRRLSGRPAILDVWGVLDSETAALQAGQLTTLSLRDAGIAFGVGGFGLNAEQAAESPGAILTAGCLSALLPIGEQGLADYVAGENPEDTLVHLAAGAGFSGDPALMVELVASRPVRLAELTDDLFDLAAEALGVPAPLLAVAGLAEDVSLSTRRFRSLGELVRDEPSGQPDTVAAGRALLVGLAADREVLATAADDLVLAARALVPELGARAARFHAVVLAGGPAPELLPDPLAALRVLADPDLPQGFAAPRAGSTLTRARLWIYAPRTARPGAEKLVAIEVEEGAEMREEWRAILRRLFHDCGRLVLTQLTGGFMSKTFRVVGYDRDGRRQLPTVVKLGSLALTRREEEAHRRYVQKFILNNSTTILGTAAAGEWAGLRYNFVGIGGPESKLTWLKQHYLSRPVPELLQLFHDLYTRVLKPWYGQPRWEPLRLYAEHDPRGLFPNICEDAEKLLGISADDETLECPELGLTLPNPFRFLKHEYTRRAKDTRLWYSAVCHGDLNLQNVLVDERDNLYVIDFSETRPRNAVADFARLEPILKLELPRMETEEDLRALLQMEVGLTSVRSLSEVPPLTYAGDDPVAMKAYEVIRLLRRLADVGTLFETDIVPYWLAVLEWTFSVQSYWSLGDLRKRHAAFSAALIVRNILELEAS